MRSAIYLWMTAAAVTASSVAFADKPTITVVIPGWSPGDGREIWPPELKEVGRKAGETVANGGSANKTIYYEWPSHGDNKRAVDDLTRKIKEEAAALGQEVDVNVIGHSRGGIVATKVLENIGEDKQFGYVQGVLLDPTAADIAGDQFPSSKPKGVDRLINYYDNSPGIKVGGALPSDYDWWRNTESDRDIEGAENHQVEPDGSDTHVSIVGWYEQNEASNDTEGFYGSKEGSPYAPKGGGSNEEQVAEASKTDQERVSGPIERGLNDLFEEGNQAFADVGREWHSLKEGNVGSYSDAGWEMKADAGWVHGRDMLVGGVTQGGKNISNGLDHSLDEVGRGMAQTGEIADRFIKNPAGTVERGLAHSGNEVERLTEHYAGGAADLTKHELGMAAAGAEHMGRMADKYGSKAAASIQDEGRMGAERLMNMADSKEKRAIARPLADTVREGSKVLEDATREGGRLTNDVMREGAGATRIVADEGAKLAESAANTAATATKDVATEAGIAIGNSGREAKQAADIAGKRARVFADDAAREGKAAASDVAREAESLPTNIATAVTKPDKAAVKARENATRVMAQGQERVGSGLSTARNDALDDAAAAERNAGRKATRARDKVYAQAGETAERAATAATRTRERVYSQAAALEQNAGRTLTAGRDRASEHLSDAEANVGGTLSRTRDRVLAAGQKAGEDIRDYGSDRERAARAGLADVENDFRAKSRQTERVIANTATQSRDRVVTAGREIDRRVSQAWTGTRDQFGQQWNDGRQEAGRQWNNARTQLGGAWSNGQNQLGRAGDLMRPPTNSNPLADISRALNNSLQQVQAQQQMQRAQQEALRARQQAAQQAAAARRAAQEQARQLAVARERAAQQAEQARRWAEDQARRRTQEAADAAKRFGGDAAREVKNAGGYVEDRFNAGAGAVGKALGF